MTLFFIQMPPQSPHQFWWEGQKFQWSFEGSKVGKQVGGKGGTLIWLMVLNNSYKERAGKVQHSSADASLDYCKPQTPTNTACPQVPNTWAPAHQDQGCTTTGLQFRHSRLVPTISMPWRISKDTEGRKQHSGFCRQTATGHSWFLLEGWAFEQVHGITGMFSWPQSLNFLYWELKTAQWCISQGTPAQLSQVPPWSLMEMAEQEQGEGHRHWADQGQIQHGFPGTPAIPLGYQLTPKV